MKRFSNTSHEKKNIKKSSRYASKQSASKRFLVVMLKVPVAGRVKTRLARDIGIIPATYFYRHTLHILIRRLAYSRMWTTILAISPDSEYQTRILSHKIIRYPQGTGTLGQRFKRIFETLAPNPILIIGSDIPSITKEHIVKAFHHLAGKKAIVGPSPDGGYWLIGFRGQTRVSNIFKSIPWSSQNALLMTLKKLSGLNPAIFNSLNDVDSKFDYESQKNVIGRTILSPVMKSKEDLANSLKVTL